MNQISLTQSSSITEIQTTEPNQKKKKLKIQSCHLKS